MQSVAKTPLYRDRGLIKLIAVLAMILMALLILASDKLMAVAGYLAAIIIFGGMLWLLAWNENRGR